jgi:CheY-like chemotaxis protein
MTTTALSSSPTVMVVEDDRDSREMLCDYLERHGYRAVSAADGQEALGLLDEVASLCLILLDLMMPIMNGWQFRDRQRAHSRFADVPVVILSAFPPSSRDSSALEVERVLTKPIDLREILKIVKSYCDIPGPR